MQQWHTDQAAVGTNGGAHTRGRREEPVTELDTIKDSIDELINLYILHAHLGERFAEAINVQAKKAGIKPGVLRKFVSVCGSGKYEMEKMKHGQLSLLFEEVGDRHATAN